MIRNDPLVPPGLGLEYLIERKTPPSQVGVTDSEPPSDPVVDVSSNAGHLSSKVIASQPLISIPSYTSTSERVPEYCGISTRVFLLTSVPSGPDIPPQLVCGLLAPHEGMLSQIYAKWPEWPNPFFSPYPSPYKIVPIKGFGPGMVATRSIARGQTIVVERPLVLYPRAMPAFLSMKALAETFEKAVDSLLPENREAVYAMKNPKSPEHMSHLQGIMFTNSLGIFDAMPGYPATYAGLPRDIARANHSCSPNSVYTWDLETATFTLRAICPIRPGEQITINYVQLDQPHSARQQELKSEYNLECKCKACKQQSFRLWMSDQRRLFMACYCARAAHNERAFEKWLEDGAPAQPPHDRLVPLTGLDLDIGRFDKMDGFRRAEVMYCAMEEESVFPPETWEAVLVTLVRAHSVLENENGVKKYALLATLLKKTFTGSDGGWAVVARNPRQTEWWGKLGNKRVTAL